VRLRPNRGVPLGLALKRNPTARTLRTGLMKSLAFSHERFLSCDAYGRPRRGRLEEAICGGGEVADESLAGNPGSGGASPYLELRSTCAPAFFLAIRGFVSKSTSCLLKNRT
jgi:hypothetical protein